MSLTNDNDLKIIGKDASGMKPMTEAIRSLLNSFPGLHESERVLFESLGEENGIIFSNNTGALILSESEDILGNVVRECQYPFLLVYRTSTNKELVKIDLMDWLDSFGAWLCKEPTNYEPIKDYPVLDRGRKITHISRDNAYPTTPNPNGSQDWIVPIFVNYSHVFQKI